MNFGLVGNLNQNRVLMRHYIISLMMCKNTSFYRYSGIVPLQQMNTGGGLKTFNYIFQLVADIKPERMQKQHAIIFLWLIMTSQLGLKKVTVDAALQ